MKKQDIRWIQRFDNFQKSLKHIEDTLKIKKRDIIQKAGLVQFFEITNYHTIENKNLVEHIDRVGKIIYQTP